MYLRHSERMSLAAFACVCVCARAGERGVKNNRKRKERARKSTRPCLQKQLTGWQVCWDPQKQTYRDRAREREGGNSRKREGKLLQNCTHLEQAHNSVLLHPKYTKIILSLPSVCTELAHIDLWPAKINPKIRRCGEKKERKERKRKQQQQQKREHRLWTRDAWARSDEVSGERERDRNWNRERVCVWLFRKEIKRCFYWEGNCLWKVGIV